MASSVHAVGWAMRIVAFAIAATVLFGGPLTVAEAQPAQQEWTLSTALGPAFALGKAGERWAALIAAKSSGRLVVKTHPGATLSHRDPLREFAALRDGAAHLAVGSSLFWSAAVPTLEVVGLPWQATTWEQLQLLSGGAVAAVLSPVIDAAGVVPLAYAPLGFRGLATVGRPVRGPDDVVALRVRIPPLPLLQDLFGGLAAMPRTLDFAAAQAAFKAGELDAQEGSLASFAAARLDAVGVRHVTDWGCCAELAIFAVNRAVWNAWTEGEQATVRDAAREAATELGAQARREADGAAIELRRRGIALTRLTPEGQAAFAAAIRPVAERRAAMAGAEIARAVAEALAASR